MSVESSVVIPVFNQAAHLSLLWESIEASVADGQTEVILVDDASGTETAAVLQQIARRSAQVTLRKNTSNRGFAASVNAGLQAATGRWLYILNSDLILHERTLPALRQVLADDPTVGISGARLLFPQTATVQHAGIGFTETNHRHIFAHAPGDHPCVTTRREVQAVAFACCCMSRQTYERVGDLNEAYFNSYEDFDYCFRVRESGRRIVYEPSATGYHWERQSGVIRSVLRKDNVARLWRDWGGNIEVDLPGYLVESLRALVARQPVLREAEYTIIDFARARESQMLVGVAEAQLAIDEAWPMRRRATEEQSLWLPLLLPVDAVRHPRPFIYVVDAFPQLAENAYWFSMRNRFAPPEIVIDVCANALLTSEIRIAA